MLWIFINLSIAALIGWLMTLHSLVKLKSVSQNYATRLDHLHRAMLAADAGFFIHNVETSQSEWDERTREIFGIPESSARIRENAWEDSLLPDERERLAGYMQNQLAGDSTIFNHSYQIIKPNGEYRWIQGTGFIVRDKANNPIDVTGFHFDITDKKEHELALTKEKQQAEDAVDVKTSFLANMSHEIRTPLNAISGILELFNSEKLNNTQKIYLNTLQNSSSVLIRIVNDILDVSKMEAGKFTLENSEFNIREIIGQCLTLYTQNSESRDILLVGYIDSEIPNTIIGDSARLQQVIINLLSNAFKFTEAGQVTIHASLQQGHIRIAVSDSGIGISKDEQQNLFDRFRQADSSTTRKYGGSGLGLSIAKDIVELWGGELDVDSKVNEGTTFWFLIPIETENETTKTYKPKGHALLCTRYPQIAELWREDNNAQDMTWVKNAEEFYREFPKKEYSQIIIEQRVEGSNGVELITWAKSLHPEVSATLIGFDKYALNESNLPIIDHYLPKPFFVNQIWQPDFGQKTGEPSEQYSNNEMLKSRNRQIQSTIQSEHEHIQPNLNNDYSHEKKGWHDYSHLKVLCVDDNKSNLLVLSGLLGRFKVRATCVNSGLEAIENVTHHHYDLILMDYEMPGMDGLEATRKIMLNDPALIVGLSAHVGERFEEAAFSVGMKGFLSKPINISNLASLLESHFQANTTLNEML